MLTCQIHDPIILILLRFPNKHKLFIGILVHILSASSSTKVDGKEARGELVSPYP